MIVSNALADLLYANEAIAPKPYKYQVHKYARGMSKLLTTISRIVVV